MHVDNNKLKKQLCRAVARALIGGGGGRGVFIYSCYARRISFEIRNQLFLS